MVSRIVSGGQTGVDRGALNAAMAAGLSAGGWCPQGRRAEDGRVPDIYPVNELESRRYRDRTERNVRDSDATLILSQNSALSGGTALTRTLAAKHGKPFLVFPIATGIDPQPVVDWVRKEGVTVLNVAGPRESEEPGIQALSEAFVASVLTRLQERGQTG